MLLVCEYKAYEVDPGQGHTVPWKLHTQLDSASIKSEAYQVASIFNMIKFTVAACLSLLAETIVGRYSSILYPVETSSARRYQLALDMQPKDPYQEQELLRRILRMHIS